MLTLDLLLKGLGSSAALGTAGCLGFCWWKLEGEGDLTLLTRLVGLDCNGNFDNGRRGKAWVCTIANGKKVKIKKGSEIFDATSLPGRGKIKIYEASENEKYKNNLKFVIEKEDITVNDAGNKLEEYETYSLKRQGVWRLELKTTVDEGIKRELRLPEDCNLPTEIGGEGVECDISGDKFKNINFDLRIKKEVNTEVTPKLKIYKLKDTNNDYGEKYRFKFVLKSEQDTTPFGGSGTKANTNTEYKIKTIAVAGTSWDELTLEKAWTLNSLGAKVGLDCKEDSYFSTTKDCGFTQEKINLFIDSGNYTTGASLNSTDTTKKIKVERDQEGYNQGFKFFVEEADITLTNGTQSGEGDKKIHKKNDDGSPTYEIKEQTLEDGATDWYLSKVIATANTKVVQQAENAAATTES